MLTIEEWFNRINARHESREKSLSNRSKCDEVGLVVMFCEILDDMLIQKIQSDKVLEGILKDIQGNIADHAITVIEQAKS